VIRAVFFDFYGVWTPDVFSEYLQAAEQYGTEVAAPLNVLVGKYFHGMATPEEVANTFRFKLSRPEIDAAQFTLNENSISPALIDFMRGLHGHFLKLGVLANLGTQEYTLLTELNNRYQLFEVITGPLPLALSEPLLSQSVFAQALQQIGEPPRNCLVVSGAVAYREFAESLGMSALPFEGFPKLRDSLEQLLANDTA
jgi:FMN phosphatase YigB (HAD superfamily)